MKKQSNEGVRKPCLLIAEIGINHNGDMGLAREMIMEAGRAGANAVKFQNYITEDFLSDGTLTYTYTSMGKEVTESQYDMFKRCELSEENLEFLKDCCDRAGVLFFSTPTNEEGIEKLERLGTAYLKNGSDYLGHLPLIRHMARTRISTILSTGMAVESEIADAVKTFRESGGDDLTLMVCTSSYPTEKEHVNLRRIPMMAEKFCCKVGFSDHTQGWEAAVAAVCLGAWMIEKHFTTDCSLPGPDQYFSSDPMEFAEMVRRVREIEIMLGSSCLQPTPSEIIAREQYRLSCVAAHDLSVGYTLQCDDIALRRPATGMPPKNRGLLIGATLVRSIQAGEPFTSKHISL